MVNDVPIVTIAEERVFADVMEPNGVEAENVPVLSNEISEYHNAQHKSHHFNDVCGKDLLGNEDAILVSLVPQLRVIEAFLLEVVYVRVHWP